MASIAKLFEQQLADAVATTLNDIQIHNESVASVGLDDVWSEDRVGIRAVFYLEYVEDVEGNPGGSMTIRPLWEDQMEDLDAKYTVIQSDPNRIPVLKRKE